MKPLLKCPYPVDGWGREMRITLSILIAERINQLRKSRKLSVNKLATMSGLSYSTLTIILPGFPTYCNPINGNMKTRNSGVFSADNALLGVAVDTLTHLIGLRCTRRQLDIRKSKKNWLFTNTPAGAQSSAVIYSLIETAKENKLSPYRYLLWVLQSAPALSQAGEFWAEKLLPANAPQECHVPQ